MVGTCDRYNGRTVPFRWNEGPLVNVTKHGTYVNSSPPSASVNSALWYTHAQPRSASWEKTTSFAGGSVLGSSNWT
jgi:hypothetical protein